MLSKLRIYIDKYKGMSKQVKATLWYTVCNVLIKGLALLSTPIFTRIMTEGEFGSYAIYQSWYSIIIIFTSINIFLGGYSKGLLIYDKDKDRFTSACLGLTSTITIIFGIIYLFNQQLIGSWLEISPILMMAMFAELLFMPAFEFWSSRARFEYKYKNFVIVSILMSVMSLGLGIIAVLSNSHHVEARVFADVFAKVLFASAIFVMIVKKGRQLFDKEIWRFCLAFNIPLIPHYLSNYVLSQSDRIMIGKIIGAKQAAFYSVAYTISMMMYILISAINNALVPYIYQTIHIKDSKKIINNTRPIFYLIAGLCILTMAFAPEIIYIFASNKYAEAIYVIPPIAASVFFIFVYSMFSTAEYYYQKTGFIALASFISAASNIILNYIFINAFGYYAAGYTTLFSYILLAILHYIFYTKIVNRELGTEIYDIKNIIYCSILVLITMFVMVAVYNMIVVRYAIIIVLVIYAFVKRNYIIGIIKGIKER